MKDIQAMYGLSYLLIAHNLATVRYMSNAVAIMYLWLIEFPLRRGEAWAWWLLLISGVVGFASFLTSLGYGYLDTWHGTGTLLLIPVFATGLLLSRRLLRGDAGVDVVRSAARGAVRIPRIAGERRREPAGAQVRIDAAARQRHAVAASG